MWYAHDDRFRFLTFAPDGDEGKDGDGDEGGAGGKGGDNKEPPSDVDKLRSEYDTKLADVNTKLKEANDKLAELGRKEAGQQAHGQTFTQVQEKLKKVDPDPVKAKAELLDLVDDLTTELGKERSNVLNYAGLYKETLATNYARDIASRFGGSVDTYRARLLKASTDAEMEKDYQLLEKEVGLDKQKNESKNNGNEQNPPRRGRQVDNGGGRAVTSDLLSDMKNIDVTTPEGRAEWEKKRRGFATRIREQVGAR